MSKNLLMLQQRKTAAIDAARSIQETALAEDRDMTDQEVSEHSALVSSAKNLQDAIDREMELVTLEARGASTTTTVLSQAARMAAGNAPAQQSAARASVSTYGSGEKASDATDGKRGWNNLGEFAQAVQVAAVTKEHDRRLTFDASLTSYSNEGTGADGGFLIPPAMSAEIFSLSLGEDAMLPMTANVELQNSNNMLFPGSETTPWGPSGIKAYWDGEAEAATQSKVSITQLSLRLNKLRAVVPVTDELMEDSSALGGYLQGETSMAIRWKTNEAILFGTGMLQPLGCMNSNAMLTIVKESEQASGTLLAINLTKMLAALPAGSFGRSFWMMNNDVLPSLLTLTLGGIPIYLPSSPLTGDGFKGSPYGLLLGRPIMVSQQAESFGSAGDINLLDLAYYRTITKAGGVQTASSMHLWFDQGVTAFRTTFRLDGKPRISSTITPNKGSNKLSPFVRLGAR
ncbi:phage major capsid protein [Candidatus Magnetaquicoccus inordinatus]|uniref:phage major capsid protein n=1 Tax=Candidatus Magnetaquicoccus inordinatus TaxID=2496818 RepID=UPI00102AD1F1|nr:phage major capsid protein [Candidatus Magnetaquicoccus inordinatus]